MDNTKIIMDTQSRIGNTQLIPMEGVHFKCEYENPTGSVKDRSLSYQISQLVSQNKNKAVLSSSGNAGISAAYFSSRAHVQLTVFISPTINQRKLEILSKSGCDIVSTLTPISSALRFAKDTGSYNLRQSKDESAVVGYESIANELISQLPTVDAVFIPVSSGTTFVGIARGFGKKRKMPAFHAVQTQSIHPIADQFDTDFTSIPKSIADGIVAKTTDRSQEISAYIHKSKGFGWVISDDQIKIYHKKLFDHGIQTSFEGAASYAAVDKAKKKGFQYKNPVCILTGKDYSNLSKN